MAQKLSSEYELTKNTLQREDFTHEKRCSQKGNKGYSSASDADKLRSKRPELQRYKPGMGLPKTSPKLNNNSVDEDWLNPNGEDTMKSSSSKSQQNKAQTDISQTEEAEILYDDCSDSLKRLKSRRPDKAVYIPKPKQANRLSSSVLDLDEGMSSSSNCINLSDSEWEGSHISSASDRNSTTSSKSRRSHKPTHDSNSQQKSKATLETNHVPNENSTKNQSTKGNTFQPIIIRNGQCSGSQVNPDNTSIHKLKQLEQFNKRNANHEKQTPRNGERMEHSDQNNKDKSSKKKAKSKKKKLESKTGDDSKKETGRIVENSLRFHNSNNSNNQAKNNNNNSSAGKESSSSQQKHSLVNGIIPIQSPGEAVKSQTIDNRTSGKSEYHYPKESDHNSNSSVDIINKSQHLEFTPRVPTLTLEPSCKTTDWCDEVEREELLSQLSSREKRRSKKNDRPASRGGKDLNRTHRNGGETTEFREKQAFHESLPPRFQKPTAHPFQPPEICDKPQSEVKVGGILHLPVDTLSMATEKRNSPSPHYIARERYSRTSPEPVAYVSSKQLYEPKGLENPSESVSNYMSRPPLPTEGGHVYVPPVLHQPLPFVDQFPHRSCLPRPPCMYPGYNLNTAYTGLPPTQNPMTMSPYTASFSDQLIHIDNQGKRIKPIVEKNISDAGLLERELNGYLSRGLDNVEVKALNHCRWKLQLRYENIILADPRFCADRNVENALWKSAFHQVIEAYRRLKDEQPQKEEAVNKAIINLVEEGTVFYDSLLEKQQETFGMNLAQFLDSDTVRTQYPDSVKFILFSVQKIYICLGDLARYREQATNTANYGKARSWYLKAQQIAPKNGRPYNQLAILALCARRKLDAVYFYMRSLAASNPFLSANESLLSLFDEARKKYEMVEKKRQEDRANAENELKAFQKEIVSENRLEIWSYPKSYGGSQHRSASKEEPLKEMSTVDLNKRFVLSFLHVHGKLFTKVGMEEFTETANQMLQEFRCLLQRTPAPYTSVRLLQLLTINLFAVANTSLKDKSLGIDCRSLMQEQALQVSLAMMAIILERSTALIQEQFSSSTADEQCVSDDLAQLLPTIKIWTDWMACQRALWHPPPNYGELKTGCKGDVWMLYADFLNVLKEINLDAVITGSEKRDGFELVTLPEDNSLAGFVPLLGVPEKHSYALTPFDKEKARTFLRINCLRYFGDYLCGIQPPYLEFDVKKNCYISLVQAQSPEDSESSRQSSAHNTSDEDSWPEDVCEDAEEEAGSDEDSEIRKLWSKKESLRRDRRKQERHQAHIEELLQGDHTRMVVEVCPRIVVPDTNCFINHLDKMKLLMDSAVFQVYVPLIVINELDGLTRGSRDGDDPDLSHLSLSSGGSGGRFRGSPSSSTSSPSSSWRCPTPATPQHQPSNHAMQGARLAVSCLEQRFAEGDPKLRSVTAKGSLLDTISFRSEDVSDNKGTNDDLILTCCLHFCPDRASNYMPREPGLPIRLQREVVLLTEDRNLVVKAMSHNVPVKSVTQFLSWAKIR